MATKAQIDESAKRLAELAGKDARVILDSAGQFALVTEENGLFRTVRVLGPTKGQALDALNVAVDIVGWVAPAGKKPRKHITPPND